MEDQDIIFNRQAEETVHSFGSDDGTEAFTTEDGLSDHESIRRKTQLRWYGHTKPERDLIKQFKATHRKNLSWLLYRAFLIEQRRKREVIKRRHLEEIAKEDQTDEEEQTKNLKVGLRSRDYITAWPAQPEVLQPENYGLRQGSFSRHKQYPTRRGLPNRALVDLSGLRPNAVPDQQDTTSDSENEESQSEESVTGPGGFAELNEKLHSFKREPEPRPSAQIEEVLLARLMKISKEKFRKRIHTGQLRTDGFDVSADDGLMTVQLRPLARNLIAGLNTFLRGMDEQAFGRGKRRLHYNNWETVMIMASQQGWPKAILRRATARCNAIFKESVRPEQNLSTIKEPKQEESAGPKLHGKNQYLCPVTNCLRHRIPFVQFQNWKEHMDRSHA
ncbi:uncharacterized protein BHQ10_009419 [Talaromyces amestolkiae]|uniref:Rrn9 domain-containing protein n=1 Tax=Talaromyces amestolkiae TaxID=1196081 RepID=A0A364LC87_TALAM|nr:uncharacterized protein BHQ10_009419 [Talaromyces amestolkiae]RAO73407.1 hypothetical protein BHQ10_009419 [Talaromyces amestolkiae]